MVEATSPPEENTNQRSALNVLGVDKEAALGLFRQAELDTHVDVVLASYIAEVEKVALVSLETSHCLSTV